MIDFDRKLIFIHIPKTGGSSVEAALLHPELGHHGHKSNRGQIVVKYGLQKNFTAGHRNMQFAHGNLKVHRKKISELGLNMSDFTVFTIMRNPWDRMVSSFRYKKFVVKKVSKDTSFHDFLNTKLSHISRNINKFIGLDYKVDHILRFENLNDDFKSMMTSLGYGDIELPHTNKTYDGTHYSEYYDCDEDIELVRGLNSFESKFYFFEDRRNACG